MKKRVITGVEPKLHSKISVDENVIGRGKVELLRLVKEYGSINAAAKEMGINYRRAWFLLETLQLCFEEPLYTTARGGAAQGGTKLTPLGDELVARYITHTGTLDQAAAPFIDWMVSQKRVIPVDGDM